MPRNVNITMSNYRTGTNVTFQRRLVDVVLNWIDNADAPRMWSGTVTFPDILTSLTAADMRELIEWVILHAARKNRGID